MSNVIEVPESCPECGALTCAEWDFNDPAQSRLHCRAQHTSGNTCTFSMKLNAEPGHETYTIVSSGGEVAQ